MRSKIMLAGLLVSLALAGCNKPAPRNPDADGVKSYIMAHPEVVEDSLKKAQAQRHDAAERAARGALAQQRSAIERDPRDFVANPAGKFTVTEFYDYLCPYCMEAAPKIIALIKANPDIRFVFKEFPIHGAKAEHASRAAIAVKNAGGDYVDLYRSYMAARAIDDATIDRLAIQHGATAAALSDKAVRTTSYAQLADTQILTTRLGIDGTPTFIVGDEFVRGADMAALDAAIAKVRAGGAVGARQH